MDREDAYVETVAEHLRELLLPLEPNAVRVRKGGGTKNVVGELAGASEERFPFTVDVYGINRRGERDAHGTTERGGFEWSTLEDVLVAGDVFEVGGYRYRAETADPTTLRDRVLFYSGRANRLDVARGAPVVDAGT